MHAAISVADETYDSSRGASSQWDAPASADQIDRLECVTEPEGSLARGALFALGIETVMVFVACGIWQIWHLIR
jgi:hypothetical protein